MRLAGIRAHWPRHTRTTMDARHGLPVAENVLQRDFAASAANMKWVANMTSSLPNRAGCIAPW